MNYVSTSSLEAAKAPIARNALNNTGISPCENSISVLLILLTLGINSAASA
jgi:hypothetical protein